MHDPKLFVEALKEFQKACGKEHPDAIDCMNGLAEWYTAQHRFGEAESLLIKAVEISSRTLGDTHPHTLESLNNLIDLYEAWNKAEEAKEWRAKLATRDDAKEQD
jgi:tetratricopeptide (TPR) repeat protein